MPVKSYRTELLKQLKDPKEAAEYLNACMSDSEEVFLLALRDVVEASGGMANLARKTSLNRENLYRSLSKKGNPKLSSLASILDAIGIKLYFAPTKKQKKAAQRKQLFARAYTSSCRIARITKNSALRWIQEQLLSFGCSPLRGRDIGHAPRLWHASICKE